MLAKQVRSYRVGAGLAPALANGLGLAPALANGLAPVLANGLVPALVKKYRNALI
jgi:hypothetical protein